MNLFRGLRKINKSSWFKIAVLAAAVLVLISFAFLLSHHHADGGSDSSCSVCRLAQQIVLAFSLLLCLGVFFKKESKNFEAEYSQSFYSFLSSSSLSDRAPPVSF